MQYIDPKTNTVYSGDRAHWTHIPVTSEQPSPYHVPVIEDGEHTGWEEDADAKRDRLQSQLDSIDARYHSDRSWREYVIANPDGFTTEAVERMQAAEDEAQPIRDELAEL